MRRGNDNRIYGNRLEQRFSNANNSNRNINNRLLANNHAYNSNLNNPQFYDKLMNIKQRKAASIKSINDLNMTKEELMKCVISPIKIEKNDASEIVRSTNNRKAQYNDNYIKKNYWNKRTNNPYKRITDDVHWENISQLKGYDDSIKKFSNTKKGKRHMKNFFKKESKKLVIHHASKKDTIGVEEEFLKLKELLESIEHEIENQYAPSKEAEYKLKFMKTQKLKYRVKYDPKEKGYSDLSNYYRKQERKYNKNIKNIDNIIDRVINDNLNEDEIKAIEAELYSTKKKSRRSEKKQMEEDFNYVINKYGDDAIELLDKYGNSALDIIKEHGLDAKHIITDIMKEDESVSRDRSRNNSRSSNRSSSNRSSSNRSSSNRSSSSRSNRNNDKDSDSKPSVTIKRTKSRRNNNESSSRTSSRTNKSDRSSSNRSSSNRSSSNRNKSSGRSSVSTSSRGNSSRSSRTKSSRDNSSSSSRTKSSRTKSSNNEDKPKVTMKKIKKIRK